MESNDRLEHLLGQMYAKETDISEDIVDEEWKRFEAKHFTTKQHTWGWMQIAAAVIGILMLSGITYAAIHVIRNIGGNTESPTQETRITDSSQQEPVAASSGIVRFDNVRLDSLLTIVAQHYQKSVIYRNDQLRLHRMLIEWNQTAPLESFIELINNFEGIRISEANDTIIVE